MTLKQIIYDVLEDLHQPFDEALYQRIKVNIGALRALFLRRDFERNNSDVSTFEQTVPFQLEAVTQFDGIDISALNGMTLRRTSRTVPQPLRTKSGEPFKSISTFRIGSKNGPKSVQLSYLAAERLPYICCNPHAANGNFYTTANGAEGLRVYVLELCLADNIFITDPWDNPQDALEIATDSSCFMDDKEYPLSLDLIYEIKTTLVNDKVQLLNFVGDGVKIDQNEET